VKRPWIDWALSFYKENQKHITNDKRLHDRLLEYEDWLVDPRTLRLKKAFESIELMIASIDSIKIISFEYVPDINRQILSSITQEAHKEEIKVINKAFDNETAEHLRIFNQFKYPHYTKELLLYLLLNQPTLESYDSEVLVERMSRGVIHLERYLRLLDYFQPQNSQEFQVDMTQFILQGEKICKNLETFRSNYEK
jgi:hypothetical protein